MAKMKRIGLLTSGGDAPGMNACIRAIVRTAAYEGIELYGIRDGYNGLLADDMDLLGKRDVSDIIQRGGTILKTARSVEFGTLEGKQKAAKILEKRGITGLIVIGGDGSMRGASTLTQEFGIATIGVPGTIDNDLSYTDFTLGFDTAVNTVIDAVNKLRDTMGSHSRCNIIEVMGRRCGDIALHAGIGCGAEIIVVPENQMSLDEICEKLEFNVKSGKKSSIIMLAEGCGKAEDYIQKIKSKIEISIRSTTLGHIQRGGAPTNSDRILASKFGYRAVQLLKEGAINRAVGIRDNKIIDMDIIEAVNMPRKFDEELYKIAQVLSI